MNKRYVVRLTEGERAALGQLISKGKAAARKRTHAQVLLKADVGEHGPAWTDEQIVEAFELGARTVQSIRKRFVEEGLDAAIERKKQCRLSRQRVLDGEKEAKLVAVCCSEVPPGQTRWTLRMLGDELVRLEIVDSISHETIRQAFKKRAEAMARRDVVHSPEAACRVCLRHGGRSGGVPASLFARGAGGVHGQSRQATGG